SAIVSPNLLSGTHALTVLLFGILRPNDNFLSICGELYDTLHDVIFGDNIGSLKDYHISFDKVDLNKNGSFDMPKILEKINKNLPKMVFIQRSRGYAWRDALSISDIKSAISEIKSRYPNIIVAVDNCYGEFVDTLEPTSVGADIVCGSLIKNPGGGIAPTGAYIAGRADLIEQVGYRLTSPSIGTEVGSYLNGYLPFFQGLFLAPTVVANALKGSVLFGQTYTDLGYVTLPKPKKACNDIIRSIKFDTENELIEFIRAIQAVSPIDSNVVPYPWEMPGYSDKVIMAAGAFVQGSSIELSADSPIKAPYIAYLQGGLTYEHAKLAVNYTVEYINILKNSTNKTN
ncbi:MAG: methionine gamma-lyase family protein, partial [Clostridia bacterium]